MDTKILVSITLLVLFISCSKEKVTNTTFQDDIENPMIDHGYHEEIVDYVNTLQVALDHPVPISFELPGGVFEDKLLIDGDIVVSREELELLKKESSGERQYRTRNLLNDFPSTIRVLGYTGGSNALTTRMRTALNWSVNNYNNLNTGLNFTLSFGTDIAASTIIVYRVNNNNPGGKAGFPNGCNPYKWVQIHSGSNNESLNVIEHIITHEIGHCLGLRHTDWFNRASCGQDQSEDDDGEGEIHIPGTPIGIDWESVMLSCFTTSEDGEFGAVDRLALEALYPDISSRIQLYEGNNASQSMIGEINLANDKYIKFTDDHNCYLNDEAKSAILLDMREGQRITIFDHSNPSGTFSDTKDDYVSIRVKQDFASYTINTFEQDIDDQFIEADYCCNGNLDGKVSSIKSRN